MLDSRKATPSAITEQPRTCAGLTGRHRAKQWPSSSPHRPTSLYKFVSHTHGLTHKLVLDGGGSATSTGQANCQLSQSNPGFRVGDLVLAVGQRVRCVCRQPTFPHVVVSARVHPRKAWSRLEAREGTEVGGFFFPLAGAGAAGGPGPATAEGSDSTWSLGRTRRSGGLRAGCPAPRGSPSDPAFPVYAVGSGSGSAGWGDPASTLSGSPTAACAWVWICPRLEEPRLIRAFPESLRYGIPPWIRPWPLCAAWGGTRLWRKRTSATPSASALCGPRIGCSCATRGKSGYTSTSGSLLGPAHPPSFLLRSRMRFTGLPYTFAGAGASSITSMIIFWCGPPMLRAPATCKLSRTSAATSVSPSRRRSWSCRHAASSSFACKVVRPGRSFLRRLIDLSMTVPALTHHISLTAAARAVGWGGGGGLGGRRLTAV